MFHVIAPASDGGHNSIDYRDTLADALNALRHWRHDTHEDIALAEGKHAQGPTLRFVFWIRVEGEAPTPVSAHATVLGAKRAYLKYGRNHKDWVLGDPGKPVNSWGFMPVKEW